jgi:hypothetical protein
MQSVNAQDPASGNENNGSQEQSKGGGSGEGAASAYARMKSQREHLARQKPGDETSAGTRKDGKS